MLIEQTGLTTVDIIMYIVMRMYCLSEGRSHLPMQAPPTAEAMELVKCGKKKSRVGQIKNLADYSFTPLQFNNLIFTGKKVHEFWCEKRAVSC